MRKIAGVTGGGGVIADVSTGRLFKFTVDSNM